MADEQKMQLTPDEQAKHAERRAALLKLTQANIASINRVREAALRFQIKQAPLSESAQEEVQAILDSCDDSLRQMILFEETVKQKF